MRFVSAGLIDLEKAAAIVEESGSALGRPLRILASTTSTNDEARGAAAEGAPHGATWVAEEQTNGRGRRGRAWISARGESLLFSTLLRVSCPPSRLPPVALLAGLAVRDAVARAAPSASVMLKWPNDVIVGEKKLAGVLVEAVTQGGRVDAVVVGVGVNVHMREFPEPIADRATSVALASGGGPPPDRARILADVLSSLDHDLHVVLARGLGPVLARIEAADGLRGRRLLSDTGEEGVAVGIDVEGRLCIRGDDGTLRRWLAGEVSFARS